MKIIILLGFLCSANAVDLGNYTYTEDIQLSSGGFIRGLKDDKYQSFLGIRYAMPPVGQLRFSVSNLKMISTHFNLMEFI